MFVWKLLIPTSPWQFCYYYLVIIIFRCVTVSGQSCPPPPLPIQVGLKLIITSPVIDLDLSYQMLLGLTMIRVVIKPPFYAAPIYALITHVTLGLCN